MVERYVKRPVVIQALQWTGGNISEVFEFTGFDVSHLIEGELYIRTMEGVHHASKGDYIIKSEHGEFYPCKPDIFEETHQRVD